MKLYELGGQEEWKPWYDCCDQMVVRAASAKQARKIASENASAEGAKMWLNPKKTWCRTLKAAGKPGVICKDVHEA